MYSRIVGTGHFAPEKIVTNADLEQMVDTTDEWIRSRSGIEQRHIAYEDQTTTDLAEQACRAAMAAVAHRIGILRPAMNHTGRGLIRPFFSSRRT